MKFDLRKISFLIALFISLSAHAVLEIDSISISRDAAKVSGPVASSPDLLAVKVAYIYDDDASRVFAISSWIANNIEYDYKGYLEHRTEVYDSYTVLKKKKALCGEYAQLFKDMCAAVEIPAVVVGGYTRGKDFMPNDTLFRSEHAWNAVLVDNKWELVDLTYAAGSVVPTNQNFKKSIAKVFGSGVVPKYKFEKQFNMRWIMMNPRQMIRTHLPELPMFQLLAMPIPPIAFTKGEAMVDEYVKTMPQLKQNSKELNAFSEMENINRWIYNGKKGLEYNPFNNRLLAFKYYQALDSMFQSKYDLTKKAVIAPKEDLLKMKRYANLADSLLKEAMKDNDTELAQLQRRSEYWKEQIKNNNKVHISKIKERLKLNSQNLKLSSKLSHKSSSMSNFFLTRYYQFKLMAGIEGVRRPKTADPAIDLQGKILFNQQDSVGSVVCLKNSVEIDLANETYDKATIDRMVHKELICTSIMEANNKKFEFIENYTTNYFPLVYKDNQIIEKPWMTFNNNLADSIKRVNADKMLVEQLENQTKFYALVKEYTKSTKDQLKLIKLAKKSSSIDQGEDSTYANVLKRYTGDMLDFQSYIGNYTSSRKLLLSYLKKQNKQMQMTIKTLQKESKQENFRHKAYMDYRKDIRISENNRIKLAQKNINRYLSPIDRGMQLAE